jgi:hypothetical protein
MVGRQVIALGLDQEIVELPGFGPFNVSPDVAHQILAGGGFTVVLQAERQQPLKAFVPPVPVGNHAHDTPQQEQGCPPAVFDGD